MADDVEQTPPSQWTDKGGMVQQQESANDWLKEIAGAAKAREDAVPDKGMDRGQDMGR